MHSDKIVIADYILRAVRLVQQIGCQRLVNDLEAREADLIEHMLEELTTIHQKLVSIVGSSKQQRQLYRRIESLLLVIILAIQSAHARLWHDFGSDQSASFDINSLPPDSNQPLDAEGGKDE